jgi:hypothetical protein
MRATTAASQEVACDTTAEEPHPRDLGRPKFCARPPRGRPPFIRDPCFRPSRLENPWRQPSRRLAAPAPRETGRVVRERRWWGLAVVGPARRLRQQRGDGIRTYTHFPVYGLCRALSLLRTPGFAVALDARDRRLTPGNCRGSLGSAQLHDARPSIVNVCARVPGSRWLQRPRAQPRHGATSPHATHSSRETPLPERRWVQPTEITAIMAPRPSGRGAARIGRDEGGEVAP